MLGGSLHDVLVRLKAQPNVYPTIDVTYSAKEPLNAPVLLDMPKNGLRLRFDGPDQRLRLIEVLDFQRMPLTYKGMDLVKLQDNFNSLSQTPATSKPNGPAFRQVYHRLFGPTFPGEYYPPAETSDGRTGTYVLSYPGVAFSFPLQASAWSEKADFVSVLSSSATSSAKCLSIFNGSSWKDARHDILTRACPHPRSLVSTARGRDTRPDEIELVVIKGHGQVELRRRSLPAFNIILGETTPQDLVAQLGPPDAIYRKNDRRLGIHKDRRSSRSDHPPLTSGSPGQFGGLSDTDRSSISTATDYSSPEDEYVFDDSKGPSAECFYNYFQHGFDVFVSPSSEPSPALDPALESEEQVGAEPLGGNQLTATKLLLHANVPGSYEFNRYRRSRWVLDPTQIRQSDAPMNSETPFPRVKKLLEDVWKDHLSNMEGGHSIQSHMVLGRGWGDSPGSSCELLGGWEETADTVNAADHGAGVGNTDLYGFPGLLFEVLKNNAVSCLTIY